MGYQKDRDQFIVAMTAEGVPLEAIEKTLRAANTIQRAAELECSSEAAYNDRVKCPARFNRGPCLCEDEGTKDGDKHGTVPRYAVRSLNAEQRAIKALEPYGIVPVFGGDPRGACVKLKVPSGRTDDWGQTGICVPTR